MNSASKHKIAILALLIVHFSGFVGMQTIYREWFISLTPLSLLTTFSLLIWCQYQLNTKLAIALMAAGVVGFVSEVVGVKSGYVFGTYHYGGALGWKWFDVPLMIAINWAMVTLAAANAVGGLKNAVVKVIAGSLIMVALDAVIEPVAPKLNFWYWQDGSPGLHNFVGWFVIGCIVQVPFHMNYVTSKNKIGLSLLMIQAVFFALFLLF